MQIGRSDSSRWISKGLLGAAVFSLMAVAGCSTPPMLTIKSSMPAYIEVNGEIFCEQTPCTIIVPHYTDGFGRCADPARSTITAFPIDKTNGYVQEKNVVGNCNDKKNIYFDMEAAGAVKTIPTR